MGVVIALPGRTPENEREARLRAVRRARERAASAAHLLTLVELLEAAPVSIGKSMAVNALMDCHHDQATGPLPQSKYRRAAEDLELDEPGSVQVAVRLLREEAAKLKGA